jgi:probable phosphoglycerate mutase
VGARADRVIARVQAAGGNVLLVSSGHILRVLAARWLALEPSAGRYFLLGTASLSILDHEHNNPTEPAIRLWNEIHEVA